MQLKLANFDGKNCFIALLKKPEWKQVVSIKWHKDETKTIEDQLGYDLLSKYPGLFKDVTHDKEASKKKAPKPSTLSSEPVPQATEGMTL